MISIDGLSSHDDLGPHDPAERGENFSVTRSVKSKILRKAQRLLEPHLLDYFRTARIRPGDIGGGLVNST